MRYYYVLTSCSECLYNSLYQGYNLGWGLGVQGGLKEGENLKRAGGRQKSAEYELTRERSNIRIGVVIMLV